MPLSWVLLVSGVIRGVDVVLDFGCSWVGAGGICLWCASLLPGKAFLISATADPPGGGRAKCIIVGCSGAQQLLEWVHGVWGVMYRVVGK